MANGGWLVRLWSLGRFSATANTVSAALGQYVASFGVSATTGLSIGSVIKVDSEWMKITNIVSTTLTVSRAYNGSALVTHAAGAVINLYAVGSFYDISSEVTDVSFSAGKSKAGPDSWVAAGGSATIKVKNKSQLFSPLNGSSALVTGGYLENGVGVQIFADSLSASSLTTKPQWFGFLTGTTPASGLHGSQMASLDAMDWIAAAGQSKPRMPLVQSSTADQTLKAIIHAAQTGASAKLVLMSYTIAPSVNDTFTVTDPLGGVQVWTFVASLSGNFQVVGIAGFAAMLNDAAGSGTTYSANTGPALMQCVSTPVSPAVSPYAIQSQLANGSFTITYSNAGGGTSDVTFTTITVANNWQDCAVWNGFWPAPVLDAGVTSYNYAGQTWNMGTTQGPTAQSMIGDVVRSEGTRAFFFQQKDGTLTFRNRNWFFLQLPNAATATSSDAAPVDAVKGQKADADTITYCAVLITPVNTLPYGVLSKQNGVVQVPALSTKTVKHNFVDPTSQLACGQIGLTLPLVANIDYKINSNATGTGTDYTTNTAAMTINYNILAAGVDIIFQNLTTQPLYITLLQVRGYGVLVKGSQIYDSNTGASLIRDLRIDATFMNDPNYAASWAQYITLNYGTAQYRVATIDFGAVASIGGVSASSLQIGDMIQIIESQAGENSKYMIVGRQGKLLPAGIVQMAFVVEKLESPYWILGDATYGALGSTTNLGI